MKPFDPAPVSEVAAQTAAISVVMPVYNAAATLPATIAAVLAQDLPAFELIAIDDGSTDHSLDILLQHAAQDPRMRVLSRTNGGVSTARNLGVETATAPLIAFLDADDLWDAGKLSAHVALHRAQPDLVASYARIAFIDTVADGLDGARTLSSLVPNPLQLIAVLGENPVCTASNLVVRRDAFLGCGGFDPQLGFAEDQELVARMVALGGAVAGIDAVLTGYRLSVMGLSMDLDRMHAGWREVVARHLRDPRARARLEALYYRYLARRALRSGGRAGLALRYVTLGLRQDVRGFLDEPRRSLATIAAALVAPVLPTRLRLRLFA